MPWPDLEENTVGKSALFGAVGGALPLRQARLPMMGEGLMRSDLTRAGGRTKLFDSSLLFSTSHHLVLWEVDVFPGLTVLPRPPHTHTHILHIHRFTVNIDLKSGLFENDFGY